jgi:hypothetical protein
MGKAARRSSKGGRAVPHPAQQLPHSQGTVEGGVLKGECEPSSTLTEQVGPTDTLPASITATLEAISAMTLSAASLNHLADPHAVPGAASVPDLDVMAIANMPQSEMNVDHLLNEVANLDMVRRCMQSFAKDLRLTHPSSCKCTHSRHAHSAGRIPGMWSSACCKC